MERIVVYFFTFVIGWLLGAVIILFLLLLFALYGAFALKEFSAGEALSAFFAQSPSFLLEYILTCYPLWVLYGGIGILFGWWQLRVEGAEVSRRWRWGMLGLWALGSSLVQWVAMSFVDRHLWHPLTLFGYIIQFYITVLLYRLVESFYRFLAETDVEELVYRLRRR